MTPLASALLGATMIAAFLLFGGGVLQLRLSGGRQRGWLMIACALVLIANVLIWTV